MYLLIFAILAGSNNLSADSIHSQKIMFDYQSDCQMVSKQIDSYKKRSIRTVVIVDCVNVGEAK